MFAVHTSGGISSRSAAFFFILIIFNTASSSSSVYCLSLILSWLLIILTVGLSVISFTKWLFGYSFHFWSLSSKPAVFSFALEVLFLPSTSFTFHYANRVSIYQITYFIDLISNVISLFFLVCVSSLWIYLSFWILAFVGFLCLSKDVFVRYSFFPNYYWLPRNSTCVFFSFGWYVLSSCYIDGYKLFIFLKLGMSFRFLQKSIKLVSNIYRTSFAYILIGK